MFNIQRAKLRLLEQVEDVLERRIVGPERHVVGRVPRPVELAVRPEGRDDHPVEREQQDEDEQDQREVEEDPPSPECTFDHVSGLRAIGSSGFDAADVEQLHDHDDEQEREHRERDRGTLGQQPGADAELVGVGREQVRSVGRSAAGHDVDQLEVGEGLDDREQHDHQRDRHEQRPGDVPEALPGAGAVDGGGLVELGTDGLQAGQQGDGEERHAAPDVDDDDRRHGEVGVAQPVDAGGDEAELEQRPVEDAEGRIEHPLPGEGREHRRDDERQQDEGADDRLALEMPVEQDRQPQAERQLEHRRHARVPERVPHGRPARHP